MFAGWGTSAFEDELSQKRELARPFATLLLVLLLHAALVQLWGLNGTGGRMGGRQNLSYALVVASPRPEAVAIPDLPVQLQSPMQPAAAQPVIEIAAGGDDANRESHVPDAETVLPPRPDPRSPNLAPVASPDIAALVGGGRTILVIVRALVLESGAIADAAVAASCGVPALDALALGQVKDHWHFLPALSRGKTVRDWISVEVLLRT